MVVKTNFGPLSSSSFEKCILSGDVKSLKSFFGDLKKSFCVPLFPCPKEEEECGRFVRNLKPNICCCFLAKISVSEVCPRIRQKTTSAKDDDD